MQHSSPLKPAAQKPVAVIAPIPQNLVQPITAQGFNSEITGVWGVSWPTQPSVSTTCFGQISWVRANIWESIGVNAQGCIQQQAPCRNNQASNTSAQKNTSTMALAPRQSTYYTTRAVFAALVGEKAGNQDHASLIWILPKWTILSDWGVALGRIRNLSKLPEANPQVKRSKTLV